MKILRIIFNWLKALFGQNNDLYKKRFAPEVPDVIKDKTIYIIGEGKYKWFVAMKCPCGCGELIQLSLEEDSSPRWSLIEHSNGRVSLYPSIWRNKRCLAHFWLKGSKIEWCKGTGKIIPPSDYK